MAIPDASSAVGARVSRVLVPVLLAGFVVDQATKLWASTAAVEPRILVAGCLGAVAVPNPGVILGFGGNHAQTSTIFAGLSIACTLPLMRVARRRAGEALAVALILAGVAGNTIDRITLGHVRDFLVVRALPTIVFNLADLLIVGGGIALLIARSQGDRRERARVAIA